VPDENVIAAIADPSRRALLDALRQRDGQTVTELGACQPQLGRHAVLKHIRVLESCDLVVIRKFGRQRYCYLNPVPIVGLARRWLDSYTAFWAGSLIDVRTRLESEGATVSTTPAPVAQTPHRHVHKIVIGAPIERV
jgi:DNA-binding transcriptional ArsR family regulator